MKRIQRVIRRLVEYVSFKCVRYRLMRNKKVVSFIQGIACEWHGRYYSASTRKYVVITLCNGSVLLSTPVMVMFPEFKTIVVGFSNYYTRSANEAACLNAVYDVYISIPLVEDYVNSRLSEFKVVVVDDIDVSKVAFSDFNTVVSSLLLGNAVQLSAN